MESVRETQKKYCSRAIMVSILAGFGMILLGEKAIGKGLVLGSIFSIINFILMGETLPARIASKKRKTFFISLGSIFFRYALLAIPLVMAIKSETYNLFAVVGGLFAVQIMIVFDHTGTLLFNKRKKQV